MTVAQQIFDKSWPLGKNGAGELIPGAAVLQERNGLDEPITLAASFQLDTATGQFLPTSKDLPLEVRVRELERLIGALAADPDALSILGRLKALADRLGDAVATPAAYTVLARLAAVEKKLADLETLIQGGIQLKGSVVTIDGNEYQRIGPDTIKGKAGDRPDADAAHAVIPYCVYWSIDTGVVEVTDGVQWVEV